MEYLERCFKSIRFIFVLIGDLKQLPSIEDKCYGVISSEVLADLADEQDLKMLIDGEQKMISKLYNLVRKKTGSESNKSKMEYERKQNKTIYYYR